MHQAVQAGHAVAAWCHDRPHDRVHTLVYLHVEGEKELVEIYNDLRAGGVRAMLFREPDRGNEATALAVWHPLKKNQLRRLPLLDFGEMLLSR